MKRILTLLLMVLLMAAPAFADELVEIRVTGHGKNEEAALQNAFRSAPRKVFGTFVITETTTENAKLVDDQVTALTKGHIDHFDRLDESVVEGVTIVEAKVYISKDGLWHLTTKVGIPDWDAQLNQMDTLNHLQEKRQKKIAALDMLFGDPKRFVQQAYTFALTGVETTDVGAANLSSQLGPPLTKRRKI